ncbi:MAG: Gfo/Idh/MocA family oxidoreductase [Chloroflexia bacterium]|nr:Gfo/Idh/MocA family oxidoreductase [Chloroflexia bacterium]
MTKTRIAVLGAGFMGGTHARAYHARDDVEIAAIYARSGNRAEELARELGSTFIDDLDRVLRDESIEAVDICLPTPAHRATTEAALAAGKHVLLEKPLAMMEGDADALVAASDATDRVFMVAHVLRFWPEYVELKRVIDSGELGQPIAVNAVRRQPFPEWSALFKTADQTGGAIYDMLIHDYDAMNWILGAPLSVVANGIRNPRSGGLDQAQVLIGYESGTGVADGGMIQPESYPFTSRLEVLCERGAIEYHFQAGGRSFELGEPTNRLTIYREEGDPELMIVDQTDAYANEVGYFIDCIQAGTMAERATPRDARIALQAGLAAKRSAETGQRIALTGSMTSL